MINGYDALAALAMAVFAAAWHWYCWQGLKPFIFLNSDAANIAGFAAAWQHPELFSKDILLSNTDNFRFYATIHIPLIRTLVRASGDYGSAFMSLLGPHVLLQSIGFYILGRVLFRNRFYAFLLAAINLRKISTGIGADFWGIYPDAIPRFTFQAVLPYLLAAAYAWRRSPRGWPWIMAAAGALVYVHPPSTPAWGLAIWLGFCLYAPREWPLRKKIVILFLLGALFAAVCIPFSMIYLGNHAHGRPQIDYDVISSILKVRFDRVFLDIPFAASRFALRLAESMLLPATVAATVMLLLLLKDSRRQIALIFVWMAGIVFASAFIPFVDHAVARANRMLPLEIDLVRGLRYVYPLCFILCLWPLSVLARRAGSRRIRIAACAIAALGVLGWSLVYRPPWTVNRPVDMLLKPRTGPVFSKQNEMIAAFRAVREMTPANSGIYATRRANPLAVRYAALRPVVFCAKDAGSFALANPAALPGWYENWKRMRSIESMPDGGGKWKALLSFAKQLDADYILADFNVAGLPHPGAILIYHNKFYSLLQIE